MPPWERFGNVQIVEERSEAFLSCQVAGRNCASALAIFPLRIEDLQQPSGGGGIRTLGTGVTRTTVSSSSKVIETAPENEYSRLFVWVSVAPGRSWERFWERAVGARLGGDAATGLLQRHCAFDGACGVVGWGKVVTEFVFVVGDRAAVARRGDQAGWRVRDVRRGDTVRQC